MSVLSQFVLGMFLVFFSFFTKFCHFRIFIGVYSNNLTQVCPTISFFAKQARLLAIVSIFLGGGLTVAFYG
jgi:hypothetical protein